MKVARHVPIAALLMMCAIAWADSAKLTDEASAIAAAKRYVKAQCTGKPCHFIARQEGSQWNVRVEFKGGYVLLYFNQDGQLVRRVSGEM